MSYSEIDLRDLLDSLLDAVVDHPTVAQHAIHLVIDGKDKDITVVNVESDSSGVTLWGETR